MFPQSVRFIFNSNIAGISPDEMQNRLKIAAQDRRQKFTQPLCHLGLHRFIHDTYYRRNSIVLAARQTVIQPITRVKTYTEWRV